MDHAAGPRGVAVLVAAAWLAGCGDDAARDTRRPSPTSTVTATASATPTPASSPRGGVSTIRLGPPRTHDDALRAIGGRRVHVDGRRIRIDPATVACGGIGRPQARVRGRPAWTRFRCIQPTFPAGSVAGPDLLVTVVSVKARRLVVERARLTRY